MATGDVYQLVRKVEFDGQAHYNVMHFEDDGSYAGDAPEEDLIASWDTTAAAGPEAFLINVLKGYNVQVRIGFTCQRISPTKGDIVEQAFATRSLPAPLAPLPTFSQNKVNILTADASRSGRGGMYLGAIPEANTNGNVIDSTLSGLIADFIDILIEYYTPSGAEFIGFVIGVWSRLKSEFNPATTMSVGSTIGTMRSRRAGRGV